MKLLEVPGKDTPKLIASWIQSSCGIEQSQPGRRKRGGAKKGTANSWSHAQKMRSSVSHFFAIDQERGSREDGSWTGNPSLSDFVSQYMKSLKRRKVPKILQCPAGRLRYINSLYLSVSLCSFLFFFFLVFDILVEEPLR